jgi:hypothetical protein
MLSFAAGSGMLSGTCTGKDATGKEARPGIVADVAELTS